MHFPVSSACTPTWPFQSPHGIRKKMVLGSWQSQHTAHQRTGPSSLRPLCGAYTDRKVTTRCPTISFTKVILSETLHLKTFLYPLFRHEHCYTSSAFVVSGLVKLVPVVLVLDCAAVATTVSGLLNTADNHFPAE